jgi:hypothetical protein
VQRSKSRSTNLNLRRAPSREKWDQVESPFRSNHLFRRVILSEGLRLFGISSNELRGYRDAGAGSNDLDRTGPGIAGFHGRAVRAVRRSQSSAARRHCIMSAKPKRPPNERDAEAYIGDMSSTLAELARQHRLATLSYLLELAQMEAERGRARQAIDLRARRGGAARRSLETTNQGRDQSADHEE